MNIKKPLLITFLVLVIGGVVFLAMRPKTTEQKMQSNDDESVEEVVPTVTSRTAVTLKYAVAQKEVLLGVQGIPDGTESIEYELSYETSKQGAQGAIGTIATADESSYEKQITLGTCSSGTCVYHEVAGPIQVTLRFNGSYGQQLFQKGFDL